jgi:hypothetical protein
MELTEIQRLTGRSEVAHHTASQLKPVAAPPPKPKQETVVREAILKLGSATVDELAGVLKIKPREAEEHLAREEAAGVIRFTGRKFQRSPVWEYTPPTEAGAAFEVQQSQREADPVVYADPVAFVGQSYLGSLPKDVRKVAREALKNGWALSPGGSGHYQLTKGDRMITVSATPNDQSAEARALRRRLNGSGMANLDVRRGEAVPFTGRPMGRTGKPGRDKKIAGTGRRVVKRK